MAAIINEDTENLERTLSLSLEPDSVQALLEVPPSEEYCEPEDAPWMIAYKKNADILKIVARHMKNNVDNIPDWQRSSILQNLATYQSDQPVF